MKKFICGIVMGIIIASTVVLAVSYTADRASFKVFLNGKRFEPEQPPVVIDGRTYLPLRAIGDALNVKVEWNEKEHRVEIGDCSVCERYKHYHALGDSLTSDYIGGVDFSKDLYYWNVVSGCQVTRITSDPGNASKLTYDESNVLSGVARLENIPADSDLISVFMGTNDFGMNVPLGSIDEETPKTYKDATSFYKALKYTCEYLKQNHPNANCFFITPPPRYSGNIAGMEKYIDAIKEVASEYSIKVCDIYSEFGTECQEEYFLDDKLHLSIKGQHFIGEKIAEFVNENFN